MEAVKILNLKELIFLDNFNDLEWIFFLFHKGKGLLPKGFSFSPRKNSGYLKKIFRIAEEGYFWVWSQVVM